MLINLVDISFLYVINKENFRYIIEFKKENIYKIVLKKAIFDYNNF